MKAGVNATILLLIISLLAILTFDGINGIQCLKLRYINNNSDWRAIYYPNCAGSMCYSTMCLFDHFVFEVMKGCGNYTKEQMRLRCIRFKQPHSAYSSMMQTCNNADLCTANMLNPPIKTTTTKKPTTTTTTTKKPTTTTKKPTTTTTTTESTTTTTESTTTTTEPTTMTIEPTTMTTEEPTTVTVKIDNETTATIYNNTEETVNGTGDTVDWNTNLTSTAKPLSMPSTALDAIITGAMPTTKDIPTDHTVEATTVTAEIEDEKTETIDETNSTYTVKPLSMPSTALDAIITRTAPTTTGLDAIITGTKPTTKATPKKHTTVHGKSAVKASNKMRKPTTTTTLPSTTTTTAQQIFFGIDIDIDSKKIEPPCETDCWFGIQIGRIIFI
uniref:Integumentary mucin C.1-like n=1 Tax=Globodera pallida TaxID=36090 RepID=A0A183BYM9_GLOPA